MCFSDLSLSRGAVTSTVNFHDGSTSRPRPLGQTSCMLPDLLPHLATLSMHCLSPKRTGVEIAGPLSLAFGAMEAMKPVNESTWRPFCTAIVRLLNAESRAVLYTPAGSGKTQTFAFGLWQLWCNLHASWFTGPRTQPNSAQGPLSSIGIAADLVLFFLALVN